MNRFQSALNEAAAPVAGVVAQELDDTQLDTLFELADVAELRADKLPSQDEQYLSQQAQAIGRLPVLFTLRMGDERGGWRQAEADRLPIFTALIDDVDAVDIELASSITPAVVDLAHSHEKPAIVSSHYFEGTPSMLRLEDNVWWGRELGADYIKIASRAYSLGDVLKLIELTVRHHQANLMVMAMGSKKLRRWSTRVLPWIGSRLTYAAVGDAVVPGQLDLQETVGLLEDSNPLGNSDED